MHKYEQIRFQKVDISKFDSKDRRSIVYELRKRNITFKLTENNIYFDENYLTVVKDLIPKKYR